MVLRKADPTETQAAAAAATEQFEQCATTPAAKPEAAQPAAQPVFEAQEQFVQDYTTAEGGATVAERPAVQAEELTEASAAVAQNAIAKAKSTAVVAARKLVGAFTDLQNVIALDDVEAMGVGAFPRVTVDLGGFMLDKEEIGGEIKAELLSWNFRYMVTTGSNDEEAKKKVKVSYDGVTVIGGEETCEQAIAAFKEEGYEKADMKCYVDLWASLVSKKGELIEEEDRPLVQIQLSPESVKKFKAFQTELGFKQARGMLKDSQPVVVIKAQRGEHKGNRYGYCTFGLK